MRPALYPLLRSFETLPVHVSIVGRLVKQLINFCSISTLRKHLHVSRVFQALQFVATVLRISHLQNVLDVLSEQLVGLLLLLELLNRHCQIVM